MLAANTGKPARERLTLTRIFEALRGLGYEGGYDAVRRYAKTWKRQQASVTAPAFVPLVFAPGEAYQFDWSHEIVLIAGVTTTTIKVAHVRLCHSRMLFVRAYPRESQEMVFDGPRPGVRLLPLHLPAGHLRQHEDRGRDDLRRAGAAPITALPADVLALPRRTRGLHPASGWEKGAWSRTRSGWYARACSPRASG